jgi:L-threonylcarbamoyladenylate synthase
MSQGLSPTTAKHVQDSFSQPQALKMILDGGPCPIGVESTIVDLSGQTPRYLRPGSILKETLERVLAHPLGDKNINQPISAPGQLERHYAPDHRVRLNATKPYNDEVFLAFGPVSEAMDVPFLNLSPQGDLKEAAANLFSYLRQLDKLASGGIAIMPIPAEGLGIAINDRLQRAAAERS